MARRGKRKDGLREPNGRLSRAGLPRFEIDNGHALAHRLAQIDPDAAGKLRAAQLTLDRQPASRECMDIVHTLGGQAKNPNLSHPVGVAFEHGLIGKAEFQAGERYGRLHRAIWGKLRADIEAALSAEDFSLLLETGRVGAPVQPSSFLRKVVAGDSAPPGDAELDPDEYQRRREQIADRLGQARSLLLRMGMTHGHPLGSILRIEKILTDGMMPGFLGPHGARSAKDQLEQTVFCDALKALAELFGYDREERRAEPPAATLAPAAPVTAEAPEPVEAPEIPPASDRRAQRRGKGLDVVFSPELDGKPATGAINKSVEQFLRRRKSMPPAA